MQHVICGAKFYILPIYVYPLIRNSYNPPIILTLIVMINMKRNITCIPDAIRHLFQLTGMIMLHYCNGSQNGSIRKRDSFVFYTMCIKEA